MSIDPNNPTASATLTFDDEFNSLSLWNGTSGTWATTWWYDTVTGNGNTLTTDEQQWYINSNYGPTSSVKPWTVSNGMLNLTATPTPASIASLVNNYKYISGEVNTYHSFSQTYGLFEMSAKLPAGQGLWPAFWLVPADGTWPPELDIMEQLGQDPTTYYTTVHSNTITGGYTSQADHVANTSTGFHTYAVDWEPDYITWYFDGQVVDKVATPSDLNKPMYMILNLGVGGNWPGPADSTTPFPATMQVDWVKVYQSGASTGGSTSTGSTGSPGTTTSTPGQTFTMTASGQTLVGGAGDDSFTINAAGIDTLTGAGGADTFHFSPQSWGLSTITDFTVGADKLDLSAYFTKYGYTGTDPIADGWVFLASDGAGGTAVRFLDHTGASQYPSTIIDLQGVSPNGLTWAQLSGGTASASSGSTGGGGSTGGQTLTMTANGQTLVGGAGNDSFTVNAAGLDTMTTGAGADVLHFNPQSWGLSTVTDFAAGTDKLDLSAYFTKFGYTGTDPIADGWVFLASDGSGGTAVRFLDHTGASQYPSTIIDLQGVSPVGLTWAELSGGSTSTGTGTGTASGLTLTMTANGQTLVGGAGNDTLILNAAGLDTMTGAGGADTFKLNPEPWGLTTITDFTPGVDKIDVSSLLSHFGYTGSDPFADGWFSVVSDGNGGSDLRFLDHTGASQYPATIVDLVGVAPSQVHLSDWVLH